MATPAEKLRAELRTSVRRVWSTDEGFEMQDKLSAKAYSLIAADYKKCAHEVPAKDFPKCLKKVAEEKHLEEEYEKLWGTR